MFGQFFQFGCFTFGGGWSIVAQMQKLYVEKEKTITSQELLDITSVGRSLPGTMIGNVAMLYGHRVGGVFCGIVCVTAMVLPPMVILSLITFFYTAFRENPWVMSAMTGVRAAIVPIIACAAVNMVKGAFRFPPCFLLAAAAFVLYLFFQVSCAALVVLGMIGGILICEYYERRGTKKHDPDAC
ncbi:MAG TPA: chromate transporter [Candidatus Eisenbergiella pullistercoris]|uniref:Chromate transporter n=1 Tax=Candidatus Eisenbergiella pullistercoris TaxID=2838555 RepID=A0A9D1YMB8_9FIRM|nr:chromate transporter [Candidatus Eisenbergiella pullistercoris]